MTRAGLLIALAGATLATAALPGAAQGYAKLGTEYEPTSISASGDRVAWSHYDYLSSQPRYFLESAVDGAVGQVPLEGSSRPFDIDLSAAKGGGVQAVYTRRTDGHCHHYRYDFARRREQRLPTWGPCRPLIPPAISDNRIAYIAARGAGQLGVYWSRVGSRRRHYVRGTLRDAYVYQPGFTYARRGLLDLRGRRLVVALPLTRDAYGTETTRIVLRRLGRGPRKTLARGVWPQSAFGDSVSQPVFAGGAVYYVRERGRRPGYSFRDRFVERYDLTTGRITRSQPLELPYTWFSQGNRYSFSSNDVNCASAGCDYLIASERLLFTTPGP